MNKCSECEYATFEDAAKGKVFVRCAHGGDMIGRVVLQYPKEFNARHCDTGAPKWCPVVKE